MSDNVPNEAMPCRRLFRLPRFYSSIEISLLQFYKQLGLGANDGGDGEGDKAGHQGGGGALVLIAEGGVTQAQSVAL